MSTPGGGDSRKIGLLVDVETAREEEEEGGGDCLNRSSDSVVIEVSGCSRELWRLRRGMPEDLQSDDVLLGLASVARSEKGEMTSRSSSSGFVAVSEVGEKGFSLRGDGVATAYS